MILTMQPGEERPSRADREQSGPLSLEEAQELVGGGLVEKLTVRWGGRGQREIDLLLNEEGKLEGMEATLGLLAGGKQGSIHDVAVGPLAFVAADAAGEWQELTEEEAAAVERMMTTQWLIGRSGVVPLMVVEAWR